MMISAPDDMCDFSARPIDGAGWQALFVSNVGHEPIILIHELPAITPEVVHLARVFVAEGFKVYLPSLMGRPGQVPTAAEAAGAFASACVRGESWRPCPGILHGGR